jgi:cytochrome b561
MIGMPLTGWIVVSTSPLNIPTLLFHTVPWPHFPGVHNLPPTSKAALNWGFGLSHVALAWGAVGLLGLHLGAVAKHHILDRDPVLSRMLPFSRPKTPVPEN